MDLVFKASKQVSSEFDVSNKSKSKGDTGGASGNFLNYQEFIVCLKLIAEKHFRVKVEKKPKSGSRGGRSKKGGIPSQGGKSRGSNPGTSNNNSNNQLSTSMKSVSSGGGGGGGGSRSPSPSNSPTTGGTKGYHEGAIDILQVLSRPIESLFVP